MSRPSLSWAAVTMESTAQPDIPLSADLERNNRMAIEFQIQRSNNAWQPYFWRIVAGNGKVLAHSENYQNKADAISAAGTVIREAQGAEFIDYTL